MFPYTLYERRFFHVVVLAAVLKPHSRIPGAGRLTCPHNCPQKVCYNLHMSKQMKCCVGLISLREVGYVVIAIPMTSFVWSFYFCVCTLCVYSHWCQKSELYCALDEQMLIVSRVFPFIVLFFRLTDCTPVAIPLFDWSWPDACYICSRIFIYVILLVTVPGLSLSGIMCRNFHFTSSNQSKLDL